MLIGHQKIWQFLIKSVENKKIPHALLFSGENQLGKKTLAFEFIKWLFNDDILKRQHPDFVFIEPVKKEIQISQIRELIWKLSLKPQIAPFKIALIDQSHFMNQEAQSAFLKTLEEPRGNTILILVSEYPEMLFPTILSRVQKIQFYPLSSAEIENYLKTQGISEQKLKEITRISMGRPGKAIDFISDSKKLEVRAQKIKELIKILSFPLALRFRYAKDLSSRLPVGPSDLREILNIWLDYFRNLLIDSIKKQQSTKNQYSLGKLKNILQLIQRTNFLISTTNINPRLALEILMLEL